MSKADKFKYSKKLRVDNTLWGIWAGDDLGYFLYWSFAPTRKEAIYRMALIWPNYPWEKARKDGCKAMKVTIKEKDAIVYR